MDSVDGWRVIEIDLSTQRGGPLPIQYEEPDTVDKCPTTMEIVVNGILSPVIAWTHLAAFRIQIAWNFGTFHQRLQQYCYRVSIKVEEFEIQLQM